MGEILIRAQLVASVSERLMLREKLVQDAFASILSDIRGALVSGCRVEIRGFGVFTSKFREGRQARNPSNGELVTVRPRYIIQFRAGKLMRETVDFHRYVESADSAH
jgi:integration host factor subunit beta